VPKRQEYSEFVVKMARPLSIEPEELAGRDDVTLTLVGADQLDRRRVLKIEARYADTTLASTKMTFYLAPELKNLIVRREVDLDGKVQMVTALENVSFDGSIELFEVPVGYKRVEDPYKGIK
jgi:hypothetical protein